MILKLKRPFILILVVVYILVVYSLNFIKTLPYNFDDFAYIRYSAYASKYVNHPMLKEAQDHLLKNKESLTLRQYSRYQLRFKFSFQYILLNKLIRLYENSLHPSSFIYFLI